MVNMSSMSFCRRSCFCPTGKQQPDNKNNVANKMAAMSTMGQTLPNIAEGGEPTLLYKPTETLANMGLRTTPRSISSTVNDPQHEAELYNMERKRDNREVWWMCTTVEVYNAMKQDGATHHLAAIPGCSYMPRWDKVLLGQSPTLACQQLVYHLTELHTQTQVPTTWILLSFESNHQQMAYRLGHQNVTLFNRSFQVTQLQIPSGNTLRFTADELASQQIWEVTSTTPELNNLVSATTRLSWSNGYVWSYNLAFRSTLVTNTESPLWYALQQAVLYTGAANITSLPGNEGQRILQLLEQVHPTLGNTEGKAINDTIGLHGAKTSERLRGHSRLAEWVMANSDWQQYVEERQQYFSAETTGEEDPMAEEPTGEGQQTLTPQHG